MFRARDVPRLVKVGLSYPRGFFLILYIVFKNKCDVCVYIYIWYTLFLVVERFQILETFVDKINDWSDLHYNILGFILYSSKLLLHLMFYFMKQEHAFKM